MGNTTNPGAPTDRPSGRATVARLETALDRISGAVVRRLERDAAGAGVDAASPRGDEDRIGAVRQRLDVLIGRLRAVLDTEGGDPADRRRGGGE